MKSKKSQIRQYLHLICPFWTSRASLSSWACLLLTFSLSAAVVYISVHMNELNGTFFNAIEAKEKEKLAQILWQFSKAIVLFMLIFSFQLVTESLVGFKWRQWMTKNLLQQWLKTRAYYLKNKNIDNPDQRISEDIQGFIQNLLSVAMLFFHNVLSLGSFFFVLWNFDISFTFSLHEATLQVPHYLPLFAILYAVLMNLFTLWIGRPLAGLNFVQEKCEADFRYCLFRVREYSEEVALAKGENFEENQFSQKFSFIKDNYYKIIKRRFYLNITEYGHQSIVSILPNLLCLPALLSGEITLGQMMQANGAFIGVLQAFTIVTALYPHLAAIQAEKNRLFAFLNLIEQSKLRKIETLNYFTHEENAISLSSLSLTTPSKEPLFSDVMLKISPGEKVLLMGRSGLGKTSLLRTLAQLWDHGKGTVGLPSKMPFFLSQKSYLPFAKLRDCMTYPLKDVNVNEGELEKILDEVLLPHLAVYLEEEKDWMRSLSLGEQQRLHLARILFHQPEVLAMDEPTSSLDALTEVKIFDLLKKKLPKQTTILTISHSENLKSFHDRCVVLS